MFVNLPLKFTDKLSCSSVSNDELLVMQLDVSSSQLLVTDSDFENPNFRERLRETVESLLDLKVVPVFNENDAISTRKAPYEVCAVPFSNFGICSIFICSALFYKCDIAIMRLGLNFVWGKDGSSSCRKYQECECHHSYSDAIQQFIFTGFLWYILG